MKICLVTAFPPSRHALNEYGFHIARELRQIPGLSLTILGDDVTHDEPELDGYSVVRCWQFEDVSNLWRVLRAVRREKPDIVWFNLGFASFGGTPLPAFLGIAIPALTRLCGFYTHVTIHQLMETVDLHDAGVRFPFFYKVGGFIATQLLLLANSVSVLLPAYRTVLRQKYKRGAVYVRKHGILTGRPEYPDFARRGNPFHRVLAFGKWGTYKRLEPLIEAFNLVNQQCPEARLVIAGTDHPKTPGYLQSIAEGFWRHPSIEFVGYVAEDEVPALFQSSSVTVMPYTSSAGSSGVAHLACAYGVPVIASDISDFRQLRDEEGMAIDFFTAGDVKSLAQQLVLILQNRARRREMALQNFSAALRMSMPEIIRQYLRTFDLQRQIGSLASISRARRIPRWVPLRSWVGGRATRKLRNNVAASAAAAGNPSTDAQGYRRGAASSPAVPVDGNGKNPGWSAGLERGIAAPGNGNSAASYGGEQ